MKSPLVSLLTVLLALAACGTGGKGTVSAPPGPSGPTPAGDGTGTVVSRRAATGRYLTDEDRDRDDKAHPANAENDDTTLFGNYGGRADPADTHAVSALVRRYYAAAAAGEAAQACSLLTASLAAEAASDRQAPSRHGACAAYMARLLKEQHQRLASDEVGTMGVTSVYAKGNLGLAVLGFRRMPAATIAVEREGRTWKVDAFLDSTLM